MADAATEANQTGLFGRFIDLDQYELLIFFTLFVLIILCTKTIRILKDDTSYHDASNKKTGNVD